MIDTPQIKICGLTSAEDAIACAKLGVHAIGCVFYPPSPRHLSIETARDICRALPATVCAVGVFVNESLSGILGTVERCGLKAVQLHGAESPDMVERLRIEGVAVFKSLFVNGIPSIDSANGYKASAYLVEALGGPLPGGNALNWDWSTVDDFSKRCPTILAGGLNASNVSDAIRMASPDAVDVSSGVEYQPGRKDIEKAKRFVEAVSQSVCSRKLRKVFQ